MGRASAMCAALVAATAASATAATPAQGDQVTNVAQVTSSLGPAAVSSNPTVVAVRIPAPATIDLLQFAPGVAGALQEAIVQGAFRSGPNPASPLSGEPLPRPAGAAAITLPATLPLLSTRMVHGGDPVFIRVIDADQNLDRTVRDTILVTISDDLTGDAEVVQLTEDGPDSGVFV